MIKKLVRIYYLSDFTLNMQLPDGYDGQDFIVRLFTEDQSTYYEAKSYEGTLTNCVIDTDSNMLNIYVDTGHGLQAGNLRSMAAFDYDNNHFADGVEKLATVTDTNIYLVKSNPNATSAMYTASTLPDLTGSTDYVTKSDLDAAGYITASALEGYVTDTELDFALEGYATKTYVADYVEQYAPQYDMIAYVTHDELSAAGYASRTSVMLKQDFLVSGSNIKTINGQSILGSGNLDVAVDLSSYAKLSDLGSYVSHTELDNAGYITSSALNGYVTESQLQQASYATESYVVEKISEIPAVDLSSYVTKDELNAAGYLNSSDVQNILNNSSYITYNELSSMGYINTNTLDERLSNAGYITSSALIGYATEAYVADYVATYGGNVDLSSYVTKSELDNAGYTNSSDVQNILSNSGYITSNELSNAGYITNNDLQQTLSNAGYITSSALSGYATEAYVAEYVNAYAPIPDLSSYVSKAELDTMSYATTTYVADYVNTYVGDENTYIYGNKFLTFTALQANSTVALVKTGSPDDVVLQYSNDAGATWNDYTVGTTITLAAVNDKVMFKGINTRFATGENNYHAFSLNGLLSISGDITSLLNGRGGNVSLAGRDYCFCKLFIDQTNYTTAPDLPSTVLSKACYQSMFKLGYGKHKLKIAPELPATTLAERCYMDMFTGCTGLIKAPALKHITEVAQYAFYEMFKGCTALEEIELPYLFITSSSFTIPTNCFNYMLQQCSKLRYIKCLMNKGSNSLSFYNFVWSVAAEGVFVKAKGSTWASGNNGIPSSWTVYEADSPETIYLGDYATTTYVADYVASYAPIPDLSSYVTKTELDAMAYATTTYVADYVNAYAPTPDLSSYVTKTELDNAGYITSSALSGYATEAYVADYVATYGGNVDLSSYVTKSELDAAAYAHVTEISTNDYNNLSYAEKHNGDIYVLTDSYYEYDMSAYATKAYVVDYVNTYAPTPDLSAYATKAYVVDYVNTYAPTPDLSAYVTKTELDNAAYINQTQLSSNAYITAAYLESNDYAKTYTLTQSEYDALVQGGTYDPTTLYIISDAEPVDLSYYVLQSYLEANYYTKAYVDAWFVSKAELSACGYLTYSNFQYDSTTNTLTITI